MKTKYFWHIPVVGIIAVLLSSCAAEYNFQIDVLKPAEVSLPGNVKKIIVINHSYIPNYCSISDLNGKTEAGFDSIFSFQHINAFIDYLKYSPRYEVVKEFSVAKNQNSKFKTLSLQTVDELCKKEGADAAVILEGCYTSKKLEGKPHYDKENSRSTNSEEILDTVKVSKNNKSSSYNNFSDYNLIVENVSYWQVYSSVTGKIVDSQSIKDISNIMAKGYDVESAFNYKRSVWDVLIESSNRAGNEYAHRIAQQWVAEHRLLYNSSAQGFNDAIIFVKNNNWDKAIELWQTSVKSTNLELASKAAYNIAVAYEVKDDLNSAIEWAAKSYFLQNNQASDKYIKILETRMNEKKQIVEQLGQLNQKPEI